MTNRKHSEAMMNRIRYFALGCLCSALACSGTVAPEVVVESYRGHYWFGVEHMFFTACGQTEEWALNRSVPEISSFIDENIDEFDADPLEPVPTGSIYVNVRGTLTGPGAYGPGAHEWLLEIRDVIEVRVRGPSDCD